MAGPEVIIIKKKPKGHAAHSAAWKVAYADFVTAMMALFLVLWLVSQTDQSMKKTLSDYFRTGVFSGAPSLLEGGSGVSDRGFVDVTGSPLPIEPGALQRNAEAVRGAIQRALEAPEMKGLTDHVSVSVNENGILIQIADGRDDLLFDVASSDLKPALTKLLADIAPALAQVGYGVELHGHTDARPFPVGAERNNWTLSFDRAERARNELERSGLPGKLILGVYAHGATMLVDKKDPDGPANRRLAIFARRIEPPEDASKKTGEAAPHDVTAEPGKPKKPEHAAAERPARGGHAAPDEH